MAAHAPSVVEGDDALTALHRKLEYFPTPPWAARAGGDLIKGLDPRAETAWEPACGEGHMVHGLGDYFERVDGSDIHDHGSHYQALTADFLGDGLERMACDWVVTNPPFSLAAQFVETGLRRARRGVALLARLALMESAGRGGLFSGAPPLPVLAPFFERVPMTLGRWDPKASTATAYAWFLWMHPEAIAAAGRGRVALTACTPVVLGIAPGARERLTRPDDARLFGVKAETPLFDDINENSGG